MSKGDVIEVVVVAGGQTVTQAIAASKAGRRVRRRTSTTKGRGTWLVVEEVTRTGKPTGNALEARMDAVASVRETRVEVAEPSKAKPKPRQDPLPLYPERTPVEDLQNPWRKGDGDVTA
jgi:hypothetical protein